MKHTQEQLEAMSDFEINVLICNYLPIMVEEVQNENAPSVMVNDIIDMYPIDPINDWGVMGPLIFDSNISITTDLGEWTAYSGFYNGNAVEFDEYASHKNPLRAVAIVYLLIKQDEIEANETAPKYSGSVPNNCFLAGENNE
jgi:hypothetical protein